MALIKCKECQQDISEKAEACPGCGSPTKYKAKKSGYAFAVFTLCFTLVSICMPLIFAQIFVPIAIVLSVVTLFKRKFIIGGFCLLLAVAGMMAVSEKMEELKMSLESVQNYGSK